MVMAELRRRQVAIQDRIQELELEPELGEAV